MATNNNNRIKQAALGALSYFAIVANDAEQSEERREFSRKAGTWITDAVKKFSGNKIVTRNMAKAQERRDILELQYDLASEALHSQNSFTGIIREATKIGESDYRGGWNKLKKMLNENIDETLKLAGDIDSVYSKQNGLILELAKNELVGNPGEEIDKTYVKLTMTAGIGTANMAIASPAQALLENELSEFRQTYEVADKSFSGKVESSINRLNDYNVEYGALFGAVVEFCGKGNKVTMKEFTDKVNEYKQKLSIAVDSIKQQEIPTATLKTQKLAAVPYRGQEFG